MSFEWGCCLNKDVCLGLSAEWEVEAQYAAMSLMECTPFIYSQPHLFSTFVPLTTSAVWPWSGILSLFPPLCWVMSSFFSLSDLTRAHTLCFFHPLQGSIKDAHFIWYHHLWFPPTMISLSAIWFSLPSLFSIFAASYLRKWQCYLQSRSPGFADRESGGGDHIRLGHGLWRMIGCACIWLHPQNLICSQ